jgi:hypothetical protein
MKVLIIYLLLEFTKDYMPIENVTTLHDNYCTGKIKNFTNIG